MMRDKANVTLTGRMVDGVWWTAKDLQKREAQKKVEYFDMLQLATDLNKSKIGSIAKQSMPEKVAKFKGVDSNYN